MAAIRKFKFNMVEIAVAIAILAFGVAAMMGLFPTILKQGKRAAEDNHTADVATLVKGLLEYECKNSTGIAAFHGKFNDVYEDREALDDYDVTDDADIQTSEDYLPFIISYQEDGGNKSKIDFKKRFRIDYYRGIYADADKENRQIIASYDVDIKKQPIPSLNVDGTYYKEGESGSYSDYQPGVTIVVKISTPAGLTPEEQEVVCFQYDYYPKD